eukprot:CAMPEP_0204843606 /NCGR_PEP_ID=MMETSP1346-20131115/48075_1 /ASSEMBLY_ACC=CAM_ASM_000771 /TAXON_ID=215587 /ORGANISM="Aplanochytrium stocchinoi, Strain GSBS06" /LENGTH=86 /DNA_ID=CAMNT_0051982771 /DNA_START=581 /DNA_END=841 /DNA_ORIENTATION=+
MFFEAWQNTFKSPSKAITHSSNWFVWGPSVQLLVIFETAILIEGSAVAALPTYSQIVLSGKSTTFFGAPKDASMSLFPADLSRFLE